MSPASSPRALTWYQHLWICWPVILVFAVFIYYFVPSQDCFRSIVSDFAPKNILVTLQIIVIMAACGYGVWALNQKVFKQTQGGRRYLLTGLLGLVFLAILFVVIPLLIWTVIGHLGW